MDEKILNVAIAEGAKIEEVIDKQGLFHKKLDELAELTKEVVELAHELGKATGRLEVLNEIMQK